MRGVASSSAEGFVSLGLLLVLVSLGRHAGSPECLERAGSHPASSLQDLTARVPVRQQPTSPCTSPAPAVASGHGTTGHAWQQGEDGGDGGNGCRVHAGPGVPAQHLMCGIPLPGTRSSLARPLGMTAARWEWCPSQPGLCTERGVSVSAWWEGGLRMLHGLSPLSLSPQPAALGSARPDPPSRPLPPDPVPKVTPRRGRGSLRPPRTRCMSGCAPALGDFCATAVPRTPPAQREAGSRARPLVPLLSHCPSLPAQAPPSDRPPPPTRPLPADPVLLSAQVTAAAPACGAGGQFPPPEPAGGQPITEP